MWFALAAVLCAAGTGCSGGDKEGSEEKSPSGEADPGAAKPNIVFVLTDDLSSDLVRYMPHVTEMRQQGMSFDNYTVTDSLCCPSRSSIYTGKYPHNTGVFTNTPPDGGFDVFHGKGNEERTFATALRSQGYRTAMMGKYLNGYEPDMTVAGKENYVPPGWDEWDVAGAGYAEYDYTLNENGRTVRYGSEPEDYLTDVINAKAQDFVSGAAQDGKPFMIELSTFTPHGPATPAPQDEDSFPGLKAPRPPAFDTQPKNAPPWLADNGKLTEGQKDRIDKTYRKRVQSVQSVDRMIGDLQDRLKKAGAYEDTVFVFSSDNGFHMGEYGLTPGKQTAFDTDVNVPLVVTGPGVPEGRSSDAVVSNIDLSPSFVELGGGEPDAEADGRSLVPLLKGGEPEDWPESALIEHHGPGNSPKDPDRQRKAGGMPPTYAAVRTDRYTYVEYADGSREYYDRREDPDQLHNVYGELPEDTRRALAARAEALQKCRGSQDCAAAASS